MSNTINKTWFKNRLRKGQLLVKCTGKYTDDYAYDAATNYSTEKEFKPATPDMFDDWYIRASHIYGDKAGEIKLTFAMCQYYEFKLADQEAA